MEKKNTSKINHLIQSHPKFCSIVKSIMVGYLVTILLFLIFSMVFAITSFPEKLLPAVVTIAMIVGIMVSSSLYTRGMQKRGWLGGGSVGLLYILILFVVGKIIPDSGYQTGNTLIALLIGIFAGAVGGIIGINLRKKRVFEKK